MGRAINGTIALWLALSGGVWGWTVDGITSTGAWVGESWTAVWDYNLARLQKRDSKAELSGSAGCIILIARLTGLGLWGWACWRWYPHLSSHVNGIVVLVAMGILTFLVLDLSLFLSFVLMLLVVPVIAMIGLVGMAVIAVVSVVCLSALVATVVGMVAFALAALAVVLAVLSVVALVAAVLFVPILVGSVCFAIYLASLVVLQCLVLLATILLRPGQYVWLLWRGVNYVCPSGRCGTVISGMRVPAHFCRSCGSVYSNLWPSLYGVLYHSCEGKGGHCQERLPTLDILGRNRLSRACPRPDCGMPFVSRSAFRLPARVVAVVGGKSAGKTTMIHMAVQELLAGGAESAAPLSAQIDTPEQEKVFEDVWRGRLSRGERVVPTSGSVPDAYVLQVTHREGTRARRELVYLYDAPGEQFESIDSFSEHQYLRRVCGILLLVDPASLGGFRKKARGIPQEMGGSATPLGDVVGPMRTVVKKMVAADQASGLPVAVVLTKADHPLVRERVGGVGSEATDGRTCRAALCEWGADAEVADLEAMFRGVRYFACSAQGRMYSDANPAPFAGQRVLEPLTWLLTGAGLPQTQGATR
jgi:hypothetical protein